MDLCSKTIIKTYSKKNAGQDYYTVPADKSELAQMHKALLPLILEIDIDILNLVVMDFEFNLKLRILKCLLFNSCQQGMCLKYWRCCFLSRTRLFNGKKLL